MLRPFPNRELAVLFAILCLGLAAACTFLIAALKRCRSLKAELAKSTSRLKLVLDNMPDGMLIFNPDHSIELMSKGTNRLLDRSSNRPSFEDLVIANQLEAFKEDGTPLPQSDWPSTLAFRGEFVRNFVIVYRDKRTGETGSREVTTAPVPPGLGSPGQIVVTYRDDSERHRLDQDRIRLASIVESSHDAIVSTDMNGLVTSWNKGAELISGYSASEMSGQPFHKLVPPGEERKTAEMIARLSNGETLEHFEADRITKDGRCLRVDISISPIKDGCGITIGASSIIRDITEARQHQLHHHELQKMQALCQLTGGIAHDFNNLLAIMVGNLELLMHKHAEDAPTVQRLQTAFRAADRGAALIRHLRAFSSNEHLNPVATSAHASVRSVMELAAHRLGTQVEVSIHIDKSMAPIFVDPAGLENALLNLILNARDAMPERGSLRISAAPVHFESGSLVVAASKLAPGDYARISVGDNGHGMTPDVLERVFEPFFTTRHRSHGTGLGLASVYGFARQSGGGIHIESHPGHGTIVSLYLPFADESQPLQLTL